MCTAVTYKTKDLYFGRTFDYGFSYGEEVVLMSENYDFPFRHDEMNEELDEGREKRRYRLIGMVHMADGVPLYYDGMNEKGLCMAGLNFPGNAVYGELKSGKYNVAQFEFIPWILRRCASASEAEEILKKVNLADTPFSTKLAPAPLHWLIADREKAFAAEASKGSVEIYENPVGVLTNNPSFKEQMFSLNDHMKLSPYKPQNSFSDKLELREYCSGMGAIGLPGDWSSKSRFVRAAFVKMNSVSGDSEAESVSQFFHIMDTVQQPSGCNFLGDSFETTLYTSCCNADKGIYYYTTYGNRQITAIDMNSEITEVGMNSGIRSRDMAAGNEEGAALRRYPLITEQQINIQN